VKEAIDLLNDAEEKPHKYMYSMGFKGFVREVRSLLQSQKRFPDAGKTITCHTDGCEADHPVGTLECKWCGTKLKWPNTKENEGGEVE
jgi:hypothetical protein